MSDLHPVAPHAGGGHDDHAHPPAELDVIPSGRIVFVGVAALVLFIVGSVAAGIGMKMMERSVTPDGRAPDPSEAGRAKIGIVEQRLFENSNMGAAWRERQHARLESFGWVDKEKGIAHIPIDRAMERVEKGERP
jgi:hypothetical protein